MTTIATEHGNLLTIKYFLFGITNEILNTKVVLEAA